YSHDPDPVGLHSFPIRRSSDLDGLRRPTGHRRLNPPAKDLSRCVSLPALSVSPPACCWSPPALPFSPNARSGRAITPSTTTHCRDRKSTRLNSSHVKISYAVF